MDLGSTEMLTYLPVWGLGSAHYPEFGGSNPPVSIGEHGYNNFSLQQFYCFLTQNQPHYASRVRIPPWTIASKYPRGQRGLQQKKEKEMAAFPSGQRGDTQDVMLRLRGFESHSSHLRILTATVYNSRAVKGVRLKLSAL